MIVNLLIMIVIGALIGGITNHLAIKMLFRPYKAKYIGKWKLPFTPGLIPKRHEEIAVQLGHVVEEYLVTEELLKNIVQSPRIQEEMNQKILRILDQALLNPDSLKTVIESLPEEWRDFLARKLGTTIVVGSVWSDLLIKWLLSFREQPIHRLVSLTEEQKWRYAAKITDILLSKITTFLSSLQGRKLLMDFIGSMFQQRNPMMGFLTNFFVQEDRLVDFLVPKLVEAFSREEMKQKIIEALFKLWESASEREISSLYMGRNEQDVAEKLLEMLRVSDRVNELLDTPIKEWGKGIHERLRPWIPSMTNWIMQRLADNMASIYSNLRLTEVVAEQVKSFPLAKLEQLILGVTAKEFRAITYLGALLGGFIGVIQYFLLR